jgi:NAD+ diphosphatase
MPHSSERSARNTFAHTEIDRASHLRLDDEALAAILRLSNSAELLLNSFGALAMLAGDALLLCPTADSAEHDETRWYLGKVALSADSQTLIHVFARVLENAETEAHSFADLRVTGAVLPAPHAALAAYAKGLLHWHARHRFCSVCGGASDIVQAGHKRKCRDAACGAEHFPRTDAAIIVAVEYQGALLLGRHPSWPEKRYSTLAGFVEPGETLEAALRREVLEEAGVEVLRSDYFSSQPWPFPASLMLAFAAEAATNAIVLGDELQDARWFTPEQFESALESGALKIPPPVSVSFRLIEHWYARQRGASLLELLATLKRS